MKLLRVCLLILCCLCGMSCEEPVGIQEPVTCYGDERYIASTIAGSGPIGIANQSDPLLATFSNPYGIAIGKDGSIYIADNGNHAIRKIAPNGTVTTLAGNGEAGNRNGLGAEARFNSPIRVVIDSLDRLYVTDFNNHVVRMITPEGQVSVYAGSGVAGFGDGIGEDAQFYNPAGIAIDNNGVLYVTDFNGHRVRRIFQDRRVETYAGSGIAGFADGIGNAAQFFGPSDLAVLADGTVIVSEFLANRIRKISPEREVTFFAGSTTGGYADGQGSFARFSSPDGIAVEPDGTIWVADRGNNLLRRISPIGNVSTVAGCSVQGFADGRGTEIKLNAPRDIAYHPALGVLIADGFNNRIRRIRFDPR